MALHLAIDPGPTHTGVVVLDVIEHSDCVEVAVVGAEAKLDNDELRKLLLAWDHDHVRFDCVSIETIRHSYGTAVGREVLDTAWWSGRMHEASLSLVVEGGSVLRADRKAAVQSTLKYAARIGGKPSKAQTADAQVRTALITIFGGLAAIGTKKAPGPLHGITSHAWQALAVGVHSILAQYGLRVKPMPRKGVLGGLWGLGTWLATSEQHEAI